MLDAAIRAVLGTEGSATFATSGPGGPHLVATWQSYIQVLDDEALAFPAGGYRLTAANLECNPAVQMVIADKRGPEGPAIGFRLTGTAELQSGNALHERLKVKYPWCRGVVVMRVQQVEQILG